MKTAEIRELYLKFFEARGHLRYPSDALVPNPPDPTLMFTSAGMVQFKPYFLGATPRFPGVEGVWKRVATAQKCLRIGDIENVGRTARHNSFFEMMGNFSFGDYFKKEAAQWAWEFLTSKEWLGLDPARLWVTIYQDDDEAYRVWTEDVGLAPERVSRFGEDENFWPAEAPSKGPNGPCGPCSEIFYDRGPEFGGGEAETGPNTGTGDRFVEIWNLVFTQFDRRDGGVLEPLPQKNIDTGFGLYRVAPILQGVRDFYESDIFLPLVQEVERLTGAAYKGPESVSHRVIAEHVRAVTFAITDGVNLSNTGAGYVIRKLLRRAIRHAYLLGAREPMLHKLVRLVVETMGDHYREVIDSQAVVERAVESEERQFLRTLGAGLARLEAALGELQPGASLSGEQAFQLYDTFGFPLDLTVELAAERGLSVDEERFDALMEGQQERGRAGSKFKGEIFKEVAAALDAVVREHGSTRFVGYDQQQHSGTVLAILKGDVGVAEAHEGEHVQVILDETPFYAEGGGQVGDSGVLEFGEHGRAAVSGTRKTAQGIFLHDVSVLRGTLNVGQNLEARVDPARFATQRHHTATHLLHAALRAVLGAGVRQAGSLVAPERLRFDFTHFEPVSREQLRQVECLVNRWVTADFPVSTRLMPIDEARASGAMALFGEKYGDTVRVVSVDGKVSTLGILEGTREVASKELCGGCHVRRTGEIGAFVVVSEEGTAAGVRRIEALCGEQAASYVRDNLDVLQGLAAQLSTTPENLPERFARLNDETRALNRQISELKAKLVQAQTAGGTSARTVEGGGLKAAVLALAGVSGNELRTAADDLLAKSGADIAVVGSEGSLVVKASKEAVGRGAHAGQLIAKLAAAGGGKGGGRPDMAQAGVKDVDAALGALESALA